MGIVGRPGEEPLVKWLGAVTQEEREHQQGGRPALHVMCNPGLSGRLNLEVTMEASVSNFIIQSLERNTGVCLNWRGKTRK